MKFKSILMLVMFFNLSHAYGISGNPENGAKLAATSCSSCHGVDGNSQNALWPNLAGQHGEYLVKQLKGFQNGDRLDPVMNSVVQDLSEQDIEDLAIYYSGID